MSFTLLFFLIMIFVITGVAIGCSLLTFVRGDIGAGFIGLVIATFVFFYGTLLLMSLDKEKEVIVYNDYSLEVATNGDYIVYLDDATYVIEKNDFSVELDAAKAGTVEVIVKYNYNEGLIWEPREERKNIYDIEVVVYYEVAINGLTE